MCVASVLCCSVTRQPQARWSSRRRPLTLTPSFPLRSTSGDCSVARGCFAARVAMENCNTSLPQLPRLCLRNFYRRCCGLTQRRGVGVFAVADCVVRECGCVVVEAREVAVVNEAIFFLWLWAGWYGNRGGEEMRRKARAEMMMMMTMMTTTTTTTTTDNNSGDDTVTHFHLLVQLEREIALVEVVHPHVAVLPPRRERAP